LGDEASNEGAEKVSEAASEPFAGKAVDEEVERAVDEGAEVGHVEKNVHCFARIVLQVLGQAEVELGDCVDFDPEENHPRNCVNQKDTDRRNTKSCLLLFHLSCKFARDVARVDSAKGITINMNK